MPPIFYKKGFKYQLVLDYYYQLPEKPDELIIMSDVNKYLEIDVNGQLKIHAGYAWDGPSGITIDTKNFMRGSLVHDGLYELMRKEIIALSWKKLADEILRDICIEDGMNKIRAWWVYEAVNLFGYSSTLPVNKKETHSAPRV